MSENDLDKELQAQILERYRKALCIMGANLPIKALCFPKKIENILLGAGLERAYDFREFDLTTIPGLAEVDIDIINATLNELFPMII